MKTKNYILKSIIIFLVLFSTTTKAQTCGLFFSEYIEGSSNNKALEIYNSTGASINLSNYKVYVYFNGSTTAGYTFQPVGLLARDSVYVIANPSAIAAITNRADTLYNLASFNGDDAVTLVNTTTSSVIDVIGIVGTDPGTNWPVGTGATSEYTLVRKVAVTQGTTSWARGQTEWNVYPQNTTTYIGNHTGTPCCATTYSTITTVACDSYLSPSTRYTLTNSGTYKDTINNLGGCDSIITINLTINHQTTFSYSLSGCDSISWQGNLFTTSQTYIDTLTNFHGCDSIITLHLTINHSDLDTITTSSCNTYSWGNTILNASGTYVDTLTNTKSCDSVVVLHLTILHSNIHNFFDSACTSYSWAGSVYTSSGIYADTLINISGCDSIRILHLTILNNSSYILFDTACVSYGWGGSIYTNSGIYADTLTNSAGCDSILTLNLTILNNSSLVLFDTACSSYGWGGSVYTNSGTYADTLTNMVGCDSIAILHLTIININLGVTSSGATLTSLQNNASYQWINCNTNAIIAGANNQSFTPSANGSYAVFVTDTIFGCSDTSACFNVLSSGLANDSKINGFSIYPNPSSNIVFVNTNSVASIKAVVLLDVTGRSLILDNTTIDNNKALVDISNFSAGIYFIKLIMNNGTIFIEPVVRK